MIKLICIGRNKDRNLQALEQEYAKRLQAFGRLQIEEVKDEPDIRSERPAEAERIKNIEASRVLEKIKPDDFVVLLDLHGRMPDSLEFARLRQQWSARPGSLVFVIAGSLGPGRELVQRADWRWKLSDLTFTHLFCRVLVLEQIYRSFMIENHRHYHK